MWCLFMLSANCPQGLCGTTGAKVCAINDKRVTQLGRWDVRMQVKVKDRQGVVREVRAVHV